MEKSIFLVCVRFHKKICNDFVCCEPLDYKHLFFFFSQYFVGISQE